MSEYQVSPASSHQPSSVSENHQLAYNAQLPQSCKLIPFMDLPFEVQQHALTFFPSPDLQSLDLASKALYSLVNSTSVTQLAFNQSTVHHAPYHSGCVPLDRWSAVQSLSIMIQPKLVSPFLDAFISNNTPLLSRLSALSLTINGTAGTSRPVALPSLCNLLHSCSSLSVLEVTIRFQPNDKPVGSWFADDIHLVLKELEPGHGLQNLHTLFEKGFSFPALLSSTPCVNNLHALDLTTLAATLERDIMSASLATTLPRCASTLQRLVVEVGRYPRFPLKELTSLTCLHLNDYGHNYCTDIPYLTRLQTLHLKDLRFPGNLGEQPPPENPIYWSSLQKLETLLLHAYNQPLPVIGGLHELPMLQNLQLNVEGFTLVSGLQVLSALSGLTHMTLDARDGSTSQTILPWLPRLHLQDLDITFDNIFSVQLPPTLAPTLTSLTVTWGDIAARRKHEGPESEKPGLPSGWSSLTNLRVLRISGAVRSAHAMPVIASLTALERLELTDVAVGGPLSHLSSLTQLTSLELSADVPMHSPLWRQLQDAGRLRHLHLSDTRRWPCPVPDSITHLTMSFANHCLPPNVPDHLESCQGLNELVVKSRTPFAGLAVVARLTALRSLELKGLTSGTIDCLDALTRLSKLEVVAAEGQTLHGELPGLHKAGRLRKFVLGFRGSI